MTSNVPAAATATASPGSRQERKERTRRAILDAALDQLESTSFDSISLRQLAKAVGIVPTGFYRHFATVEELGLALVDESFLTLRGLIREVRSGDPRPEELIDHSIDVLVAQLDTHFLHFRFIARERHGGSGALREAIRHEFDLFERELVTDLARMPQLSAWGAPDLHVLASLFVELMVGTLAEVVSLSPDQPSVRRDLLDNLRHQGRMILVGAGGWTPLQG